MLWTAASGAAAQQRIAVAGTIVRLAPNDSLPVEDVPVVLHRVGRDFQGPIDSTTSRPDGKFSIGFVPDTASVYILSARYGGVQYFSSPVHTNSELPDTAIRIVVSDTSTTVRVEVAARHIVIGAPRADGTREVVDLISLENNGWLTRVAGPEQAPTWITPLQEAAIGFDVGASDFSPEAVFHRDGQVQVFGPIAPGTKELLIKYLLPASTGNLRLAFADTVRDLSLLIEDTSPTVVGPVMLAPDSQVIAGRSFRTWRGRPTPADTIEVLFPDATPGRAAPLLATMVAVVGLALLVAAWMLRRRSVLAPSVAGESVAVLVRRLALLDSQYAGRQASVPKAEWDAYHQQRDDLKERVARALATGDSTS